MRTLRWVVLVPAVWVLTGPGAAQGLKEFKAGHKLDCGGEVRGLVFSPDGKTLAVGERGHETPRIGTVRLWDVTTGKEKLVIDYHAGVVPRPETYGLADGIGFTPDGKKLAAGCGSTAKLFDTATGKVTTTIELGVKSDRTSGLTRVALSPDGKTLATESGPGHILQLWDVATRRLKSTHQGGDDFAFTPDSKLLVLARLGVIQGAPPLAFLDVPTSRPLRLSAHQVVKHLDCAPAPSHDGKLLIASISRRDKNGQPEAGIAFWDLKTGKELGLETWDGYNTPGGFTLTPDDRYLLVTERSLRNEWGIRVWDVATRRGIDGFEIKEWLGSIAFSPDGRTFATNHYENNLRRYWVRVWTVPPAAPRDEK